MHCNNGLNNKLVESLVENKVAQETGDLKYLQDSMYDFVSTLKEIILGEYSPEFFNKYVDEALKLHGSNLEEFLKIPKMGLELRQALESIDNAIDTSNQEFKDNLVLLLDRFQTTLDNIVFEARDAYETALDNGFEGTKQEWLKHLEGDSAYEIATKNGYTGSEEDWLNYLKGDSAYEIAVDNGFVGTKQEWLTSLKPTEGTLQALTQFMNNDAETNVTVPELGNIPSLQGHIKQMFQNGGLPATPFTSKALMEASALVDGDYAQVTDDSVAGNNGLYLKTAGAWVKSAYDPLTQALERVVITPQQTTFFMKGDNLFDGKYLSGTLSGNPPYGLVTDRGGLYAVIPVSAGTEYTISIAPGTDRFRIACFAEFPQTGSEPTSYHKADNDVTTLTNTFTLTTDPDTKYLVVVPTSTALSQAPEWLYVGVGSESTEYTGPYTIKPELIKNSIPLIEPEMTTFFEKGRNLFDGKYLSGTLKGNPPYNLMTDRGGLLAIVPVSAETEYTVTVAPGTNRFRFACFAEYPRKDSEPTSYYKADDDTVTLTDEYTLTTDPDTKYLVVIPTSAALSKAPEWLQVEVGAVSTPYSRPISIKPELLPAMGTTGTTQRNRVDVVVSGDFDAPYEPITPAPVMDSSLNLAVIYDWFDDLVARFPDLWSRSLLATDTSGLPVYRYDCKPPVTRGILSESLPKILHVNGIHGDEKQAQASGMRFYKDLTDNWQSSKLLETFRWNVHFIVIPAFNAYGVDNSTRGNASGVNLNRNFPINWKFAADAYNASGPEPLSEPESVAIMELLKTEKNIIFAIDHHCYNPYSQYPTKDAFTIWTGTNNTSVNKYLSGWSRSAQVMFAKKHPELAVGNLSRVKIEEALAMRSLGWLSKCFIDKGIPGTILEISRDSHLSDFHTSALGSLFGFALKELHADKNKWFK